MEIEINVLVFLLGLVMFFWSIILIGFFFMTKDFRYFIQGAYLMLFSIACIIVSPFIKEPRYENQ